MNYYEIENCLKTQLQKENNGNDTQLPTFEILSYIRVLKAENTKLLNANKELSNKVANLEVENEVFKRDAENLERTLEEVREEIELFSELKIKFDNGRLVEFPHKVGDKAWKVYEDRIKETYVNKITQFKNGVVKVCVKDNDWYLNYDDGNLCFNDFDIYFTNEEAEERFKQIRGE